MTVYFLTHIPWVTESPDYENDFKYKYTEFSQELRCSCSLLELLNRVNEEKETEQKRWEEKKKKSRS